MIRAVFFDWFNTLADYEPPRHQLHWQACREHGIELSPETMRRSITLADRFFFAENTRSPVEKRSPEEKTGVYIRYQEILFAEAGVRVAKDVLLKILARAHELFKTGVSWALFDDVLPTLKALKEKGLTLGLLTNATRDVVPASVYHRLGLEPYLDFIVTSEEAGEDKPHPAIFRLALERAGVAAAEAMHVGDQYDIDIAGAKGIGINPVLLDRQDANPQVTDCPRIRTLPEIVDYI